MRISILVFSLFLSLSSCTKSSDNNFQVNKEFDVIYNGLLSGNGSEGITQSNRVINNTTDWKSLMSQMNSVNNVSDNFTETDIDFGKYLIIAVFLEVKQKGWEVQISSIIENENNLVVSKKENEFDNSVITQPFSIVKMRRTEKAIEFK